MNIKNWSRGLTVVIDGEALLLTGKPKKAIDGSHIVFGINSSGVVKSHYIKNEDGASA
jgi:hypothetical protein